MNSTEAFDYFVKRFNEVVRFCVSNNLTYQVTPNTPDYTDITVTFMKSSFPNLDTILIAKDYGLDESVYSECSDAIIEKLKNHFKIGDSDMDNLTDLTYDNKTRIRDNILDKAKEIINGERQGQYGKPENSFQRIAEFWSGYLGKDLTDYDVANMMILMKVARNAGGVYKDDNWIDICGYAAIGAELQAACKED